MFHLSFFLFLVGAKYAVAVSVGCHEIRSTFKPYENGACEWVELAEEVKEKLYDYMITQTNNVKYF